MSPEIIAAIATGVTTILGAHFGLVKWMIDKFLKELRPNGGASLKDQVNRLEKRVDDIYSILSQKEDKHG